MIDPDLVSPIGLGGLSGGQLLTFDFAVGERLKPYVCKILGRDFTYGFKREFVSMTRYAHPELIHNQRVHLLAFDLEPFYIYEYKRFMGGSLGEVEEGYIGLWPHDFVLLEREAVESMCGNFRQRAIEDYQKVKRENKTQTENRPIGPINPPEEARDSKKSDEDQKKATQMEFNFAPDDIPF